MEPERLEQGCEHGTGRKTGRTDTGRTYLDTSVKGDPVRHDQNTHKCVLFEARRAPAQRTLGEKSETCQPHKRDEGPRKNQLSCSLVYQLTEDAGPTPQEDREMK